MKEKIKILLKWAVVFLLCFILIYLFVFFGGWRLFESGDPILIEIGVAAILSFFVTVFGEIVTGLEKRVKALEQRLNESEKRE